MSHSRITVSPEPMGGVPCIRGLRLPVATVVGMVADGMSREEMLEAIFNPTGAKGLLPRRWVVMGDGEMLDIIVKVPEKVLLAEKVDPATFARELPMLAAVKLYELGRLSSGRAAELAGMSRIEFLLSLERYKVFPLIGELQDLESGRARRRM